MDAVRKRAREALEVGDWPGLLEALGYSVSVTPIPSRALIAWGWRGKPLDGLQTLVSQPGLRIVHGSDLEPTDRRALAKAVWRQNPTVTVLWLWTSSRDVTLGLVDALEDGRLCLRTMAVDRESPDPGSLEQVLALAAANVAQPDSPERAEAFRRHFAEVLDQEGLTRAFFRGFRDCLQLLLDQMQVGPTSREEHDVALVTLLRMVFLYFLQKEGLLAGDRRFLARHLRRCRSQGRSFHDDVLRPLFFGALNTEVPDRDDRARQLGEIPFLNGGLFEPVEGELRTPNGSWSNEVWTEVIDGFFERFHFTAQEPDEDVECRVVDPEMLGKVFEGLMYGDDRHRSGAFYTPRDIVRRMVGSTIDDWLTAVTGIRNLDGDLTRSQKNALRVALGGLTILDPAVGTGAFLLEALWVLRRWYDRVGWPCGWNGTPDVVHHHLFGVDVEHTAVRLCELRLWLAILSTADRSFEMRPLPNLSHRIANGNSLIEPGDFGRLADSSGALLSPEARARRLELEARLEGLQARFLTAHGRPKRALRSEILQAERELQAFLLDARRARLAGMLEPFEALEQSKDLFGQPAASVQQRHAAQELRCRIESVDRDIRSANENRTSPAAFGYESRFGTAARRGFDLVVTNPPWVRAHRLDRETREVLAARYRSTANDLWPAAVSAGIRAPFGTQPDLSALFVERGLELLAPGGRLCALVPAKLFRSLHGAPLREVLHEHRVCSLEDLSEADRELFEATTYPAIITVEKARPRREFCVVSWRGRQARAFSVQRDELGAASGHPAEPWLLIEPELREVFRKMQRASVPLGTVDGFAPTRGIFTGANEAFIRAPGVLGEALGAELAAEWVRPLLSGASLGEGEAEEILWAYDDRGQIREEVPPEIRAWFEPWAAKLRGRSDRDPSLPPWQLFRVRPDTVGPKVAWRDIGPRLEAHIVDPEAVPLNTVYYLPCSDDEVAENVAAWMNSLPVRAFARQLAERARGGWRRHFAWVVRMLPVPRQVAQSGFMLSEPVDQAFGLSSYDLELLDPDASHGREAA